MGIAAIGYGAPLILIFTAGLFDSSYEEAKNSSEELISILREGTIRQVFLF